MIRQGKMTTVREAILTTPGRRYLDRKTTWKTRSSSLYHEIQEIPRRVTSALSPTLREVVEILKRFKRVTVERMSVHGTEVRVVGFDNSWIVDLGPEGNDNEDEDGDFAEEAHRMEMMMEMGLERAPQSDDDDSEFGGPVSGDVGDEDVDMDEDSDESSSSE
jgi:hypothetical protein